MATAVGWVHKVRASDVLLRRSMSPNVRRECVRWFQKVLWLVAGYMLVGCA